MNKVFLIGRLTKTPETRYTAGNEPMAVSRFNLAVDRRVARNSGQQTADFIGCVAFGKKAEFCEKYLLKGSKVAITGRIQTGSYQNQEGRTIYTTDIVVEDIEFAGAKVDSQTTQNERPQPTPQTDSDGFMSLPDGAEEELPWS